jgi:CRISPR-associated protein Cas2
LTVIVLTAVPSGLRGHLTRWLLEISPGVFVGHVTARVREHIWERVVQFVGNGRALMVYTARNEQWLAFEVHGHEWTPVDFDGVVLMRRQTVPDYEPIHRHARVPTEHTSQVDSQALPGVASETAWKRTGSRHKFKPTP